MSDETDIEKPKKKYVPVPPGMKPRVIEPEVLRAEIGIEPINTTPAKLPRVTQTKTVTTTSSDDADLRHYIQPHGKFLIDELLALLKKNSTKDTVKVQVINSLLDRGFGRPSQTVTSQSTVADLTSLHLEALRNTVKPK